MTNKRISRKGPGRAGRGIPRGLAGSLVERLLAEVASGKLRPGDRLPPEPRLAERMGVSRPTLRQALKTLEAGGILEARPRRGTTLAQSSPKSLGPLFGAHLALAGISLRAVAEARAVLESSLARLAARNRKARDLERLEAALADLEDTEAGAEEHLEAEMRFHGAIVEAAGNPVLGALRDVLGLYFEKVRPRVGKSSRRRQAAILRQHRRIYEAIRARRSEETAALVARHLAPTLRSAMTGKSGGRKGG